MRDFIIQSARIYIGTCTLGCLSSDRYHKLSVCNWKFFHIFYRYVFFYLIFKITMSYSSLKMDFTISGILLFGTILLRPQSFWYKDFWFGLRHTLIMNSTCLKRLLFDLRSFLKMIHPNVIPTTKYVFTLRRVYAYFLFSRFAQAGNYIWTIISHLYTKFI